MSTPITVPAVPFHGSRRASPVDSFSFRVLCWATTFVAVLALIVSVRTSDSVVPSDLPGFLAWTLLVIGSDLLSVELWGGMQLATDLPLLLAAAMTFGPFPSAVMGFFGSVDPREFRREVSLPNALFNRAQVSLSVMAAAYIFRSFHVSPAEWPLVLLVAALALGADVLVNGCFVAIGVSLKKRVPLGRVLRELHFGSPAETAVGYAAFGLLGVVLATLYQQTGPWGLAAFALPVLLARQALARAREAEAKERQLRVTRQALDRVSERVAEERFHERARIAAALHDEVLQSLHSVTLHAQVIREDLRCGRLLSLEDDVPGIVTAAEQAGSLIREVVRDLRRSPLGRRGVSETLLLLVNQLKEEADIEILAEVGLIEAEPAVELLTYQIAKEALFNGIQHAGASLIRLTLISDGVHARLIVEDNGVGFTPQKTETEDHFGLQLMRERVNAAGGELQIVSEPDLGTTVVARIPLREME